MDPRRVGKSPAPRRRRVSHRGTGPETHIGLKYIGLTAARDKKPVHARLLAAAAAVPGVSHRKTTDALPPRLATR
jgi:hypothetical protein